MKDAAVGIGIVTKLSGHLRNGHVPAENPSRFNLPWNGVDERPSDCRPIELGTMIIDQDGFAVIWQNIALRHAFAPADQERQSIGWHYPMETCKHQPIEIAERERFGGRPPSGEDPHDG
jgi:hypothetical protein